MINDKMSSAAIAEQLGERLRQIRLNADLTQTELAAITGLSRRMILNAEKGNVHLKNLVAILVCLGKIEQLNVFLPVQEISPLQLAKLAGKKRQRASGTFRQKQQNKSDEPSW